MQIANALRAAKSDVVCGIGEMARPALDRIDMERFVFCDSSEKMLAAPKQVCCFKHGVYSFGYLFAAI